MSGSKLVALEVLPGNVVYIGTESYGPGQVIEVPAAEAKVIREQGQVKDSD